MPNSFHDIPVQIVLLSLGPSRRISQQTVSDSWGEPALVPGDINALAPVLYSSVSEEGIFLLTRMQPDDPSLYKASGNFDGFAGAEQVVIPAIQRAYDQTLALDGSVLAFISAVAPGSKQRAVFVTRQQDGKWSAPALLYSAASGELLLATGLSRDAKAVYFSSNKPFPQLGKGVHIFSLPIDLSDRYLWHFGLQRSPAS